MERETLEALAGRGAEGSVVGQQLGALARAVRDRMASVRHTVAVMSGKGGVGKSAVTSGLAQALAAAGHRVGVVDADVNGPCVPRMLGVRGGFGPRSTGGLLPGKGHGGVKVASTGLLLGEAGEPVDWKAPAEGTLRAAWRGALEMSVVRELVGDVEWGELDVLLFDLPPGTGDKETVLKTWLPALGGALFVATPSGLVLDIVEKSVRFAAGSGIRQLGLVLNFDGACCPKCGEEVPADGDEDALARVGSLGLPLLARVPRDLELGRRLDGGGALFQPGCAELPSAARFRELATRVWACLEHRPDSYL